MKPTAPAAVFVAVILCACSKPAPPPPAPPAPVPAPAPVAVSVPAPTTGTACTRKLITQADVDGILKLPIAYMGDMAMIPDACRFSTTMFPSVTITLAAGQGDKMIAPWLVASPPEPATPLPGVGDRAVWLPDSHTVIAEKHNTACMIEVSGQSYEIAQTEGLATRLGALCNRILTAAS